MHETTDAAAACSAGEGMNGGAVDDVEKFELLLE